MLGTLGCKRAQNIVICIGAHRTSGARLLYNFALYSCSKDLVHVLGLLLLCIERPRRCVLRVVPCGHGPLRCSCTCVVKECLVWPDSAL